MRTDISNKLEKDKALSLALSVRDKSSIIGGFSTANEVKKYFQEFIMSRNIKEDHARAIWIIFESLEPKDPTDLILCSIIASLNHQVNMNRELMYLYSEQAMYDNKAEKKYDKCVRFGDAYTKQLVRAIETREKYRRNRGLS